MSNFDYRRILPAQFETIATNDVDAISKPLFWYR